MEKKEDRRVKITKRMLKDALIELLKEKDIYHVSIRELCDRADVNRTTFYKYYASQFDLLADMERDILDFIEASVKHNEPQAEKIVYSVCCYIEENLEFIRLIINNNVDPTFAEKLFSMDIIRKETLKRFKGHKTDAELEYLYSFLTYGTFRMICVWMNKEKRESPEDFARLIDQALMNW